MVVIEHCLRDSVQIDRDKYVSVFARMNKKMVIDFAKKHFVAGTYRVTFYEPSDYYSLHVERAEVEYWVRNTDLQICGNCHYWNERKYKSGRHMQVCELDHIAISVAKDCDMHLPAFGVHGHGLWSETR